MPRKTAPEPARDELLAEFGTGSPIPRKLKHRDVAGDQTEKSLTGFEQPQAHSRAPRDTRTRWRSPPERSQAAVDAAVGDTWQGASASPISVEHLRPACWVRPALNRRRRKGLTDVPLPCSASAPQLSTYCTGHPVRGI